MKRIFQFVSKCRVFSFCLLCDKCVHFFCLNSFISGGFSLTKMLLSAHGAMISIRIFDQQLSMMIDDCYFLCCAEQFDCSAKRNQYFQCMYWIFIQLVIVKCYLHMVHLQVILIALKASWIKICTIEHTFVQSESKESGIKVAATSR